jgi:hypothetical protein
LAEQGFGIGASYFKINILNTVLYYAFLERSEIISNLDRARESEISRQKARS